MLNKHYYVELIKKYCITESHNSLDHINLEMIRRSCINRNVHFNFPQGYDLSEIINLLYAHLSAEIFLNHADLTDYCIGDKLKRRDEKGKNIYTITRINGQAYTLEKDNDESKTKKDHTFDELKRKYAQVKQNTRNSTLSRYEDFFGDINEYGFLPTHFSKKLVLIAGQTIWNNLRNKDCIPTIYLPNTREGEQSKKRSIEALEDCIAYVTPKYEVCYDELLRKNTTIDTILVCDTDLDFIHQIIQDQSSYDFNLIVLSAKNGFQISSSVTVWNWRKEEVDLLANRGSKNVDINCINDNELQSLFQHFESCIEYVNSLGIRLKSFGYFLRLALNALQKDQFENLLMRLERNKELERNEGGYEDFADKNPKEALKNIISYLQKHNSKRIRLNQLISSTTKSTLIVADREDVDSLKTIINNKCKIITHTDLKRLLRNKETDKKTITFYSFNGRKDFEFIYHLPNDVRLILYEQEKELYDKQFQNHKSQLEEELISDCRIAICNIKYDPITEPTVKVNPTLDQIIERLEQSSDTAYDGYKDESDSLLDDLEERITYKVSFTDNSSVELESNETVFDAEGNLIKSYRLKIKSQVRIYPQEQLAENLFQVAINVEPEKFGKIDEHSTLWLTALKELALKYKNRDRLYSMLKQRGLKVLPSTVDAYFKGYRKFPMFNSDLRAILDLNGNMDVLNEVKKSKRLYNSTMIALGRGVKSELQQFLRDESIGDILQKKNFTKETLRHFVNEYMPLLTIKSIEEVSDEQ